MTQLVSHNIEALGDDHVRLVHAWSRAVREVGCDAIVSVTSRIPNSALFEALEARSTDWSAAGIRSVRSIGDALAPGLIAHAVYAGHRLAREFDEPPVGDVPFRRHLPVANTH